MRGRIAVEFVLYGELYLVALVQAQDRPEIWRREPISRGRLTRQECVLALRRGELDCAVLRTCIAQFRNRKRRFEMRLLGACSGADNNCGNRHGTSTLKKSAAGQHLILLPVSAQLYDRWLQVRSEDFAYSRYADALLIQVNAAQLISKLFNQAGIRQLNWAMQ
jgi:hypothetical protein